MELLQTTIVAAALAMTIVAAVLAMAAVAHPVATAAVAHPVYQLQSASAPALFLAAAAGDAQGSWSCNRSVPCLPLRTAACDASGGARQRWAVAGISSPRSFVLQTIVSAADRRMCVAVANGSSAAGTAVVLAPCGENTH